jgi:alpha-tubulin suppressor-like RCC1 family protein
VALAAGGGHTAAVTESGEVYVWGYGDPELTTPGRVGGALLSERAVAVSAGDFHTAVLTAAGSVYTFGGGDSGQLGHGDNNTRRRDVPALVRGALRGQVAAGRCASNSVVTHSLKATGFKPLTLNPLNINPGFTKCAF